MTPQHVTLSIRLPADLHDALAAIAEQEDRSINYVVRSFLLSAVAEPSTGTRPAETVTDFHVAPVLPTQRASRRAS